MPRILSFSVMLLILEILIDLYFLVGDFENLLIFNSTISG